MARGAVLAFCIALMTGPAQAACRLALALGLDVSGSVDAQEYRLQLDGVASALLQPDVQGAIFGMPGAHVTLAVYQWGAADQQSALLGWTDLRTPEDVASAARTLRAANSTKAPGP